MIDEQVSELYIEYDKATALGETTREMAEITVKDIDKFVVLCDELLDKGISLDITRASRQLNDQAAELQRNYTALRTHRAHAVTFADRRIRAEVGLSTVFPCYGQQTA